MPALGTILSTQEVPVTSQPTSAEGGVNFASLIDLDTTGVGAEAAEILLGDGDPNGNVTSGNVGSLFLDAANATLYIKTAGPSTWVAFTTGGGGVTDLQTAYAGGNTISVTAGNGSVALANTTDAQDVLTVDVSGAGSGNAITVTDGTNSLVLNGGSIENDGGDLTISTAAVAGDGFDIDIVAGQGTTEGGDISITTGAGTAGTGGDLAIAASDGTTGGGAIAIFSGDGIAANAPGGAMTIDLGDGFGGVTTSPGAGGGLTITGGAGGDATDTGGFGATGGAISLTAGDGGDGDGAGGGGNGGGLTLRAGNPGANGTPGAGGNVLIEGGNNTGVGGAAAGNVNINTTAGTGQTTIGNATDHATISLIGRVTQSYTAGAGATAFSISTDTTVEVVALSGTSQLVSGVNNVQQITLADLLATVPAVTLYTVDADPNGNITALRGSFAFDGTNGAAYINTSAGATGTTWSQVSTGAGGATLQTAYAAGNTIAVTAANGTVDISNDTNTDATDLLTLSRDPVGATAGNAISITMGNLATGNAIAITDDAVSVDLTIDPAIIEHTGSAQIFRIRNATGTAQAGSVEIAGGTLPTDANANGGSVTLQGGQGAATGTGSVGGAIIINAGAGNGTNAAGGAITLTAGAAAASAGVGGGITLVTGAGSNGTGGGMNLTTGDGGGGGGDLTITTGTSSGTASGGDFTVTTGNGGATGGSGGNLSLTAGNGLNGVAAGGAVTITSGNGNFGGGDITITAGNAINAANNGGDVSISAGDGVTSGAGGSFTIQAGDSPTGTGGTLALRAGSGGGTDGTIFIGDVNAGAIASGPGGGNIRWTHRGILDLAAPTSAEGGVNLFEAIELNGTGTGAQTASILIGDGNPSGAVTSGDVGSLFIDAANATLYMKTAAGTTWTAFASGGGNSLQQAYDVGATITTDGSGAVEITKANGSANGEELFTLEDFDDAAPTNTMIINKSPDTTTTGGDALEITMGANASGQGITVSDSGTGSSILINKIGASGNAFIVQDGGTPVFQINAAGEIGFFNTTPAAQTAAYTPTNVTPDRSFDANSTTLDELADVVGTIIADLQAFGLFG